MSRRLSFLSKQAKQDPEKPRPKVRFPDELVFLDNIKENDMQALNNMLRRASLQMDISGINNAGITPLHQAVLDGNSAAVQLLISHGANINKQDEDSWTPLHAACADGYPDIVKILLDAGADPHIRTMEGERPLDLVEASDFPTIKVMLEHPACNPRRRYKGKSEKEEAEKDKKELEEKETEEEEEEEERPVTNELGSAQQVVSR
ncbi:hypothetical protein CHS0354_013807 [Potamilus streckersoni]|uniref:Uncharacterized protein n=1 Tax=Potamilus streckersoni TaxID=2493646 RepID=A0AAE0SHM3_9BIVA|nr:hypothetical protein CHS0354_013807 [Potamilus streckersoni]